MSLARARAYHFLDDYDEALKAYAVAQARTPTNRLIFIHRAELHLKHGNYRKAIDDFTVDISIAPDSWAAFKKRGAAYFFVSEYQKALNDLRKARELNPRDLSTLSWIPPAKVARCPDENFRQGLLELADEAVQHAPDNAQAHLTRAEILLAFGRNEEAVSDLKAAAESETADYAHYQHALLCLILDEAPKYRDACATMLAKFGGADDAMAANFVAWTCALAPDAVDDYEPLVAYVAKAVEARPGSDQFLNTLGAVHYRAGHKEYAIEWLTELDGTPEDSKARTNSSLAYTWYLLAMILKKSGNEEQARQYLTKANEWTDEVLANEENPPSWNRRATLELLREEAEEVLAAGERDLQPSNQKESQPSDHVRLSSSHPFQWILHYRRGRRFAAEGNWTEAASAFSEAIQLRPDDWRLWKARGEAHEKLDEWDQAIGNYRGAIGLAPDEYPSWKARADTLAQYEQWDKALDIYNSLVKHDPGNRKLRQACAAAHVQLKQWDKAIKDYDQLIKLTPDDSQALRQRAEAYAQLEQWDLERSGELGDQRSHFWAVLLLVAAGDTEGYRRACARLYERFGESEDPKIADWLAWVCKFGPNAIDDLDRALEFAQRAVASDPDSARYQNNYTGVLYRAGRYQEAADELNEAMRLRGGEGAALDWIWLAMVHHRLGNADEARQWLDKARSWIDQSVEGQSWTFPIESQLLRREAEELMNQTPEDNKVAINGAEATDDERQPEENGSLHP